MGRLIVIFMKVLELIIFGFAAPLFCLEITPLCLERVTFIMLGYGSRGSQRNPIARPAC